MKLPWRFDKHMRKSYLVNNLQILVAYNTILLIKLLFLNDRFWARKLFFVFNLFKLLKQLKPGITAGILCDFLLRRENDKNTRTRQ
jgi:hypothetical protein